MHQLPALASRTSSRGTRPTATRASRSSASTRPSTRSRRSRATSRPASRPSASTTRSRSTTRSPTWTNYRNRYWPAHYLIDAEGTVRHISFGEGNYAATEQLIRELLEDADPGVALPPATEQRRRHPRGRFDDARDLPRHDEAGELRAATSRTGGRRPSSRFPADQPADAFALDGALGARHAVDRAGRRRRPGAPRLHRRARCGWCSAAPARSPSTTAASAREIEVARRAAFVRAREDGCRGIGHAHRHRVARGRRLLLHVRMTHVLALRSRAATADVRPATPI